MTKQTFYVWFKTNKENFKYIYPMVKCNNNFHYRVTDASIERLRKLLIDKDFNFRPVPDGWKAERND